MSKNILLTSLDAPESDRSLKYYSVRNEFGCDYCEALQSMEASTKFILARFPIDEIFVIGEGGSEKGGDDGCLRLKDAVAAADAGSPSAYDLYRSRIAQYINELDPEQQAYDALLPEEERAKLIDFIAGFQQTYSRRETKRLNRFFDELACSRPFYEQFRDAVFAAFPNANRELTMRWVKNYLYTQLKPSAKLEILPVNENIRARYVTTDILENQEAWASSVLDTDQNALDGNDATNLFISLGNDSAVDATVLLNMIDILVSTPGNNVHLKKIYKVNEASGQLTGDIEDNTAVSLSTDLVAAAHAFLNYSKTDMLVDFWKNCGQHDERVDRLIYAARHVDVGISMCNIPEVQEGIQQLRRLYRDERSWAGNGEYGLLFGVIAGCIQADYAPLLAGDGGIPFIELIKWANRHQLYQQVLTLIESNAPTELVKTGIFYYCDDEAHKAEVTKLFALQRLELKPYEYYKIDDLDHYFIKNYDRSGVRLNGSKTEDRQLVYAALRARSIENPDPAKINGHTACDNIDTVQNVLYAYFHLGTVRNKISHADSGAMAEQRLIVSESDVSSAMLLMRESIEFFILSYEKALEEVRGKKPNIVSISPDDVRSTADNIRRSSGQGERCGKKQ